MRPIRNYRESVDFFRFCNEYEDVFVTEDGSIIYACADNIGCPFMTCSRVYACTLDEMSELLDDDVCPSDELSFIRSKEWTQADICWLDSLDRAPLDIAREVIAWEYAFVNRAKDRTDSAELGHLHDIALEATQPGRAHFTYQLPIAS